MNKEDFRDGDWVEFLDTPYNRERKLVGLTGYVCHPDWWVGLMVRVPGYVTMSPEGQERKLYAYYLKDNIQVVKKEVTR